MVLALPLKTISSGRYQGLSLTQSGRIFLDLFSGFAWSIWYFLYLHDKEKHCL